LDRTKASDFHPEVLKLFDGYVHGSISRREFLDRAAKFAVGGVTAAALLESLSPNFAWAQTVPQNDARIRGTREDYPSPQGSGQGKGYLVKPAGVSKAPAVIVIHENRGLNPYIEDVARRLALEGYIAFAPDALAPAGGYPGNEDRAREMFAKLDNTKLTEDLLAACSYLKRVPEFNGKFGAVGFCFGGGIVNTMATRIPELSAGVPFYGKQPPVENVPKIKAAMQMHYAEQDPNINSGIDAYRNALASAGVRHEIHIYPKTQHGFHNDTTPRYDEAAAKLAWSRTLAWFKQYLA
jgi:carboxymethylenebutenolidase